MSTPFGIPLEQIQVKLSCRCNGTFEVQVSYLAGDFGIV